MEGTEINASARPPERRLHTRHQVLLSCVRLADSNGGIVLNVCERGLALRAARTLAEDQFAQIRFQLSQSNAWIEARTRIAWMSASKMIAGVEFVELSNEARTLLTQWVSSIADATVAAGRAGPFPNTTVAAPSVSTVEATDAISISTPEKGEDFGSEPSQDSNILEAAFLTRPTDSRVDLGSEESKEYEPQPKPPELPGFRQEKITPTVVTYRRNRFRLPPILVVTSALLAAGFFGLALFLHNERVGKKEMPDTTTGSRPALPAGRPSSTSRSTPPQELPSVSAASKSAPGFVLQAGAMRRQENAYALARSLQQEEFPAFIFRRDAGHFYEVFVGPYGAPDVAAKTKKRLQDQGFATTVRHWPLQ